VFCQCASIAQPFVDDTFTSFLIPLCLCQGSIPCSLDCDSSVLPLSSSVQPAAADTFLSFSLPPLPVAGFKPLIFDLWIKYSTTVLLAQALCHCLSPDTSDRIGIHDLRIWVECSTTLLPGHNPLLMIPLLHFFISLCQCQGSIPCSLDFESSVLPLCSRAQPAAADTFLSFSPPVASGRFQILDLWIMSLVYYHCPTGTSFMSSFLSWCQWQDWNSPCYNLSWVFFLPMCY
jgi:hypothetical protein